MVVACSVCYRPACTRLIVRSTAINCQNRASSIAPNWVVCLQQDVLPVCLHSLCERTMLFPTMAPHLLRVVDAGDVDAAATRAALARTVLRTNTVMLVVWLQVTPHMG